LSFLLTTNFFKQVFRISIKYNLWTYLIKCIIFFTLSMWWIFKYYLSNSFYFNFLLALIVSTSKRSWLTAKDLRLFITFHFGQNFSEVVNTSVVSVWLVFVFVSHFFYFAEMHLGQSDGSRRKRIGKQKQR